MGLLLLNLWDLIVRNIDGSFALVACVLREATHSCRATDCLSRIQHLWVWCPVPKAVVCT